MVNDPIMQTAPRRRVACWHQPCSTCRLLSINIRVTGVAETDLLPSNGMVRSFRGRLTFGRPTLGQSPTFLPTNCGDRSHHAVPLVGCRSRRLTLLRRPDMAEHGKQREIV